MAGNMRFEAWEVNEADLGKNVEGEEMERIEEDEDIEEEGEDRVRKGVEKMHIQERAT